VQSQISKDNGLKQQGGFAEVVGKCYDPLRWLMRAGRKYWVGTLLFFSTGCELLFVTVINVILVLHGAFSMTPVKILMLDNYR